MKKLLLSLLVLTLLTPILAQSTEAKPVSIRRAVIYSALLPGAGEIYAHSYNKGAFFLGVEAAILFSYFRLDSERQWKIDSYKEYAASFAGVPVCDNDDVYRRLQHYLSSDEYNKGVEQDARNYFLIYLNDEEAYQEYVDANVYTGDDTWQWASQAKWERYKELRGEKQDLEIYAKFALGAALINRVISIIDAARTARNYNHGLLDGQLTVLPDWRNKGFFVNYAYHF